MPDEAIEVLDTHLAQHPSDDEALALRGMKHWAAGRRRQAINDLLAAKELNPQGKARLALDAINAILSYRNKDLLNP